MIKPMRAISSGTLALPPLGALALTCILALAADADIRRRWYVDFELGVPKEIIVLPRKDPTSAEYKPERIYVHNKPALFQYQDRLGSTTLVWFIAFTMKNPTDQYVPIQVDFTLRTDEGKDFHQDIFRTDLSVPPRGKVYSSVVNSPDMELRIVSHLEKLGNRNEEMQRERLQELKRENRYLNVAELRRKGVLKPAEEVVGLAIFRDVDRHNDTLELMVSGLVDVARITKVERDRTSYAYESRILHFFFDMPGDEFAKIIDFVSLGFPKSRKWEIHQVGPVCDKTVLPKLIEALAVEDPVMDESMKKVMATVRHGPEIRRGAHDVLKKLTGLNHPFDATKPPNDPDNLNTIRLFREWWTRNSEKLVYNDKLNRFDIVPQVIPGSVEVKPPYAK
jgi:hypothetical protein